MGATQPSFSDIEHASSRRTTRRTEFLAAMDEIICWDTWTELIKPYYYSSEHGRPPRELEVMLRMYLLQVWFSLSDVGCEEACIDIWPMRTFLKLDTHDTQVPDATTLANFRHIIEKNKLDEVLFDALGKTLSDGGIMYRGGTIVDATFVESTLSTKNAKSERGPEMHQAKKASKTRGEHTGGIVEQLKKAEFDEARADLELFWGIRDGSINIYYKCASLAEVTYHSRSDELRFKVAEEYLGNLGSKSYKVLNQKDWLKEYKSGSLKQNANNHHDKGSSEKIAQQILVLSNNQNPNSNWYCFDIEYCLGRPNAKAAKYGRFDILAISKQPTENGKHKILLIELKYGKSAYASGSGKKIDGKRDFEFLFDDLRFKAGSGITGHVCDYARYLSNSNVTIERLKEEIQLITTAQSELGLPNVPVISADEIDAEPIITILTVTGGETVDSCRLTMLRYLFDNAPGKSSSRTAEKLLSWNNLGIVRTNEGFEISGGSLKEPAAVSALFVDHTLNNLIIRDIYDMSNYEVGWGNL